MPDIAMSQVMQFHSNAVDDGELQITQLAGNEVISKPYEFHLELVSKKPDLSFADLLKEPAWIGIKQGVQLAGENRRAATTLKIHGILSSFEQVAKELEWVKYRAVLVPKLWRLGLAHQSRIFQSISIPDLVKKICQDYDIEVDDEKLGDHEEREYIVQYEESDLDFIHRWMEHEGIFYYFEQTEDHEKLILADSPEGYGTMPGEGTFSYKPTPLSETGAEAGDSEDAAEDWFREEVITGISCNYRALPKEVVLNDYNWRDPDTLLECTAEVSSDGKGTVYHYNDHYGTKEQGKALAKIRAEEIKCREQLFEGRSDSRGFRAGLVFEMTDHYRNDFNQEYLLIEVSHAASQAVALGGGRVAAGASYSNGFVAMPKLPEVSYRPETKTPWPSIKGVMHAKVDGSDNGTPYAQIDDKGRYKVKLPLDRGDAQEGDASKYVRKSEMYAGPGQGMHFPLLKDSEVLITHIDGDPDRPIISGAVYNEKNTTVVNAGNVTLNRLATPAGHEVQIDDTTGAGGIKIFTKDETNIIHLDATDGDEIINIHNPKNQITLDGDDWLSIKCENENSIIRLGNPGGGSKASGKAKNSAGVWIGTDGDINELAGGDQNIQIGGKENKTVDGKSNWTIKGSSAEYKFNDWFSFKAAASVETSVGAKAVAQIGAEAKVAYALSASVTRGDGFEATWGKKLTINKSDSRDLIKDDKMWKCAKEASLEAVGAILVESKLGEITLDAMNKITLKCGASKIEITPQGIKFQNGTSRQTMNSSLWRAKSTNIDIKGTASLKAKGTPGGKYE